MADVIDAFSFHRYTVDERDAAQELRALSALVRKYCPGAAIIQGESGGQSSPKSMGALRGLDWNEEKQVKHLLRQRIVDLGEDLLFTSHFSMLDMAEALNGDVTNLVSRLDFGYFGLLAASFDENGIATGTYKPKAAYYAMQTLTAVLGNAAPDEAFCESLAVTGDAKPMYRAFAQNGKRAVAYWAPVSLMDETYEGKIKIPLEGIKNPVLVDMRDGAVYELPDGDLPLTDCPMMVMDRGFAAWTEQA